MHNDQFEPDEKTRLLPQAQDEQPSLLKTSLSFSSTFDKDDKKHNQRQTETVATEIVVLKKNLTVYHGVFFIVTTATGAGIFISPSGVTENVVSVGASLCVWLFCGLFSTALAFCYCELGTAFPVAGGEYAFVYRLLGRLPGFLTMFVTVFLLAPLVTVLMSKTAAQYIMKAFNLQDDVFLLTLYTVFIIISFAVLNTVSINWTVRTLSILTLLKILLLVVIMVIGIVFLVKGNTENFDNMFDGTPASANKFASAFLPAYVAYTGWDSVTSMGEEIKNPQRDLPLSAAFGMLIVIFINVLTNMAYFTFLSPEQFVNSETVAVEFANVLIPGFSWIIPVFVALAAVGTVTGSFLGFSRYTYAAGIANQLPEVFSFIHKDWYSPFPAIILQCVVSLLLAIMPFLNLGILLQVIGLLLLMKTGLTLIALLHLKRRYSHLHRTVKVPVIMVLVCLLILLAVVVFSIIEDPLVNGLGCLSYFLGVPFYLAGIVLSRSNCCLISIEKVSRLCQLLLLVVPTDRETKS